MEHEVKMPQLGESVVEGTIGSWLKQEGDAVEKYEALVEVITDKVNAEVPSPASGTLKKIVAQPGETIPIGATICLLDVEGAVEAATPVVGESADTVATPAARATAVEAQAESKTVSQADGIAASHPEQDAQGRRFSPAVRRLAQEHGIDPRVVPPTGAQGRVTRDDVLNYLERRKQGAVQPLAAAPTQPAVLRPAGPVPQPAPGDEVIPLTPMRRTIAKNMVESVQTIPHAWMMIEADVTGLVKLRAQVKDEFARREGFDLTFLPFVIKAAVEALREVPDIQAVWAENSVIRRKRINIGVAVAVPEGLVVPVIADADHRTVAGLAYAVNDLAQRARTGKLGINDIQGGTFTVDNTGSFGSVLSMPIIPPGQSAIMTVERIEKRPVIRDDAIAIRSLVNLCMSIDHRVLDGEVAGRFLQAVKTRLEAYAPGYAIY